MTMPKLQAARVTQCGLDFAVVLVDPKLFMNPSELEAFSERAQALFPGVPVAMLSYDDLKVTRYHGPDDVVAFLRQVRVVSLPGGLSTPSVNKSKGPKRFGPFPLRRKQAKRGGNHNIQNVEDSAADTVEDIG